MLEDVLGDAIVEHALAFDHLMLLGIEGGGIVLEVLDQRSGLRSLIQDLRLALVDAATAAHRRVPWLEKVHDAVAPLMVSVRGGGTWGRRATRHDSGRPNRNSQASPTRCGVQSDTDPSCGRRNVRVITQRRLP